MKPDRATRLRYAWRAALIAALAAAILAFGYSHGRAWLSGRAAPPYGPARVQAPPPVEPLADSTLVTSHRCTFNGDVATFAQYRSSLPAEEVIAQFEDRFGKLAAPSSPRQGTMMRMASRACAAAGAIDSDGSTIGIVAYGDPKTGGSTYFVGRSRPSDSKGWQNGDAPGAEVPGIPRPPNARRVFCIEGLGGITSRLLVYEGWGSLEAASDVFAAEMPKDGWTRNQDAENVIQKRLEGKFLSFLKGTSRAMVYIERDKTTNKVRTAVAYSVKDWLPPDRGL